MGGEPAASEPSDEQAEEWRVRPYSALTAAEQADTRAALQRLHIFRLADAAEPGFLTRDKFDDVCSVVQVREAMAGDVIQQQGHDVAVMHCVMAGRLAKLQNSSGGTPDIVGHLTPGDQVGQLHMIAGSDQASSSIIVDSDTATLACVAQADLERLMRRDPALVRVICRNLALSLRDHHRRHRNRRLVRFVDAMDVDRGDDGTLLATVLSSIGAITVTYPLEVAGTLLQKEGRGDILSGLRVLLGLLRKDGIGSWYRGWTSNVTSQALHHIVYNAVYSSLQDAMRGTQSKMPDVVQLLLGIAAGCAAATAVAPLSTATFRMQTSETQSATAVLLHIARTKGPLALWGDVGPGLILTEELDSCATFYCFDELKTRALRSQYAAAIRGEGKYRMRLTPSSIVMLGVLSKAISSLFTFPLLIANIRMGLYGTERYPTVTGTFIKVLREEGPAGLFKGMGVSLLRSVAIAVLEFLLYDTCLELARRLSGPPIERSRLPRFRRGLSGAMERDRRRAERRAQQRRRAREEVSQEEVSPQSPPQSMSPAGSFAAPASPEFGRPVSPSFWHSDALTMPD